MVKWATTAGKDEIATIDTIDYSKFYKLDKEKIKSANPPDLQNGSASPVTKRIFIKRYLLWRYKEDHLKFR